MIILESNYNINIFYKGRKSDDFQKVKVFIDEVEIKPKNHYRSCVTTKGRHKIRIEQMKLYKSKYFYLLVPIYIILILISGDSWILDFSPFYAIYEAEFYLNKDISIEIFLNKNLKSNGRFKKVVSYYFNVIFNSDIEMNIVRNDFLASAEEKIRWRIFNSIVLIIPIVFIIYLIIILF